MPRQPDGSFTDRPTDRVVGVLGGMGPHATVDFFAQLVRATEADKDWNHLHIVVEDNPRIPSRTRAFLFGEESPAPHLAAGARRLEAMGAHIIGVPCNSAAYFLQPAREAVRARVLDPVTATADALRLHAAAPRRPAVLGGMVTARARLYTKELAGSGIEPLYPDDAGQAEVAALIEALKKLDTSPAVLDRTQALVRSMQAAGADAIVLGCTELGLIADRLACDLPVLNSNALLARQLVSLARSGTSGCPS